MDPKSLVDRFDGLFDDPEQDIEGTGKLKNFDSYLGGSDREVDFWPTTSTHRQVSPASRTHRHPRRFLRNWTTS
ncbi:hypothetical protein [Halobellus ordinarius]|uniref:hypothetical protein n=1 Tax=Halobellus ordinarius TaxID=3075120 RepID=UPI0028806057|nr:hypothetical protein [Halobellus sp. ZY16]